MYVNARPWPPGYVVENPLMPPPCAQEIDIHVIDLAQMQEVGKILRSHVAYSPFNECFFISLDVCNEFVARYDFLCHNFNCCIEFYYNPIIFITPVCPLL